jgi:hypothetical protein
MNNYESLLKTLYFENITNSPYSNILRNYSSVHGFNLNFHRFLKKTFRCFQQISDNRNKKASLEEKRQWGELREYLSKFIDICIQNSEIVFYQLCNKS